MTFHYTPEYLAGRLDQGARVVVTDAAVRVSLSAPKGDPLPGRLKNRFGGYKSPANQWSASGPAAVSAVLDAWMPHSARADLSGARDACDAPSTLRDRARVLGAIRSAPRPLTVTRIAGDAGLKIPRTRAVLASLLTEGAIKRLPYTRRNGEEGYRYVVDAGSKLVLD